MLNHFLKGSDIMVIPGCPYGAEDCPKVSELRKMIEKNGKDLQQLNDTVVRLDTTIKNASKLIGVIVSILLAIIGAMNI